MLRPLDAHSRALYIISMSQEVNRLKAAIEVLQKEKDRLVERDIDNSLEFFQSPDISQRRDIE